MSCSRLGLSRTIQFIAMAAALLFSRGQVFAVDGPSFDCSHGVRQTLAVILCTNPEAAQADWDVNRAYWALFTDDREETKFNEAVNQRCAIPPLETQQETAGRVFVQEFSRRMLGSGLSIPTPQPLTEQHVRCVVNAFHNRAAELRSRLTGDALVESNLSPDEHTINFGAKTLNHGIVIVGWDDTKKAWLIKNSWGTLWGSSAGYGSEKGYMWIAYNTNNVGIATAWVDAVSIKYLLKPAWQNLLQQRFNIKVNPIVE